MPLLNNASVDALVELAHMHRECGECGHHTAFDYCRSCDQYYWVHQPGCRMHEDHGGHRLYLIPFVEVR
jgi:hypothetical protein